MAAIFIDAMLFFIASVSYLHGVSERTFTFVPIYDNAPLVIQENSSEDTFCIETLKFYISKIELLNEEEVVFAEKDSYHLVNAAAINSASVRLSVPDHILYTEVRFNIGIDSLTSVSGAFGGDLDPTNGMYWTWQSGYINFKLEGVSVNCPARNRRFQYHIGGYQHPYNTLQNVVLSVPSEKNVNINIAIDKIFEEVNVADTYQIMSPNPVAVEFSALLTSLFYIDK